MSHRPHLHDDHSHHHHDHPHTDTVREVAIDQKLAMLLEHWIKHNETHAQTYREWAQKAVALGMHDVRARIEEAVVLTLEANRKFEEALQRVRERG
jgi:hypothetical protein